MDRPHNCASVASDLSSASSGPYADIVESASSDRLLAQMNARDTQIINIPSDNPAKLTEGNSRCVTVVAVLSLIISILSLVCVGFFIFWFFVRVDGRADLLSLLADGQAQAATDQKTTVCLPCLQVSPDPLDRGVPSGDLWRELDVRFNKENNTKICCATNMAQYAALFKLILQRQEEVKKLADTLDSPSVTTKDGDQQAVNSAKGVAVSSIRHSPSAHLAFKPSPSVQSSDEAAVQRWLSPKESPFSHAQNGMNLVDDKRVVVDVPGLYFIYCQIYTSPSGDKEGLATGAVGGSMPNPPSTYVKRYSTLKPSYTMMLLKSRHTRHNPAEDRHSSYVGGVFRLYKGDALSVLVSRPDLVQHDPVASFFGLFRVGE